ncbi:MAG: imidazolonepropionase [Muribaculaceae bacterium]|nr:imidazolonepropionase [Muribaculaceae bacterium]
MYIVNISKAWMVLPQHTLRLAGADMESAPGTLSDCWMRISPDGLIEELGAMASLSPAALEGHEVVDADGGCVLPAFCDSHTHIIYAGSRDGEFLDKIRGLSYEEIARRGGGILNSADRLHETSETELFRQAQARALMMIAKGTGAMEIKSGYGLNTADELKMLRVAAALRDSLPAKVRITFLGAHAVGRAYAGRRADYVDMLIADMLPAVAAEGLADYVDVFCDEGFFTTTETARILEAAAHYGMRPKIHANELACSGGVQVGVAHDALSVDHLERMGQAEIEVLKGSRTVATMLPGASFFLGMPYAPARRAVDSGLCVALASDYNPGSSPSGDMRMVWALGCIKMRLTPQEALSAVTLNGAAAMDLSHSCGALSPGRAASFIITRPLPSQAFIPYEYTTPWIKDVYLQGKVFDASKL